MRKQDDLWEKDRCNPGGELEGVETEGRQRAPEVFLEDQVIRKLLEKKTVRVTSLTPKVKSQKSWLRGIHQLEVIPF